MFGLDLSSTGVELREWKSEDLVPVSALQAYVFCPRQCALVHMEQVWEDNVYTIRGKIAHERLNLPEGLVREGIRVEYALPIWSERLGLVGRADVVEFPGGIPYPVEHKVGPRRWSRADEVQLCAQGLCLEEMFGVEVRRGALFYRKSRRRREVEFTRELRELVAETAERVRELLRGSHLPPSVADARCKKCAQIEVCMPYLPEMLERFEDR